MCPVWVRPGPPAGTFDDLRRRSAQPGAGVAGSAASAVVRSLFNETGEDDADHIFRRRLLDVAFLFLSG